MVFFYFWSQDEKNFSFAMQNGPILLDEKRNIPVSADLGKPAAITAIGLDKNGHIIVIIMTQSVFNNDNTLSLYDFANVLKDNSLFAELNLHSVLNLDRGPSTGLMFADQYYSEINRVQNVIVVKPN